MMKKTILGLRLLASKKKFYQVESGAAKRVAELNRGELAARKAGQGYGRFTLTAVPINRVVLRPVWQEAKLPPIREAFANKTPLPPVRLVLLKNGQLDIEDGIHRVNAAIEAGHTHIPAIVEEYIQAGAEPPPPLKFA